MPASRRPITAEERFFITHDHVGGVLGITGEPVPEPSFGQVKRMAKEVHRLRYGGRAVEFPDRGHALRARDVLNVVRQAVRNSAADHPGIAQVNRRAIEQCASALKTLERFISGSGEPEIQLRGELARALAVQHERAAIENDARYRLALNDEMRRDFDKAKMLVVPRSVDPRFAFQVTGRGEREVDEAVSKFAVLSAAFQDLRIAHGSDGPGRPARHAQHEALLRLTTHFRALTGKLPSDCSSKKPGNRVGDQFRAFVRAGATHASGTEFKIPAGFFSEADFRWLLAELRRSNG
jgi:hypothetical protein